MIWNEHSLLLACAVYGEHPTLLRPWFDWLADCRAWLRGAQRCSDAAVVAVIGLLTRVEDDDELNSTLDTDV